MMPVRTPHQLLVDGAKTLDIPIDSTKATLFMDYLHELRSWNERFNLTAITSERDIVIKHFLDSLVLLSRFDIPQGCTIVDIGSGAGFPGIPLKIMRPDISMVLIESSQKKARFLSHIISLLDLKNIIVSPDRVERFAQQKENREHFCLAVARAVAHIVILLEYALPLVEIGGRFIAYKGKEAVDEVSHADNALNLLGGRIEEVAKVVVPFLNAERYLVIADKVASSPKSYPRRAGVPVKKPLL
ncbi:MAG TPA: 16S rRNA (guanine(527)-N(7))-methyltransferase RsmG [Anaerolineae bacterium]|jgi:16S rRNA (guanine527-N7)-methyltransferase|nr:16S rRNA (guanine(527)-N(7))-methyltransferase RsmG [Anaerolineae bacterium]